MNVVLIVFMVVAAIVCIFSMVVVIVDMVKSGKNQPVAETVQPVAQPIEQPVVTQLPAEQVESVAEQAIAADAESPEMVEIDENTVVMSRTEKKTLNEMFRELDEQFQHYYVEIVQHAMGKPDAKQVKNDRYEEYKIGNTRLVRLQIKKGVIVCEVNLVNSDFMNYMADNKMRIKQAPTAIKIEDERSVELVKNVIDIAFKGIEEEREYKRQLRNERRRNARKQNA